MKKPEDKIRVGDVVYTKNVDKLRFYKLIVRQKKVKTTSFMYNKTGEILEETETKISFDGKEEMASKDCFDFDIKIDKMHPTWADYFDQHGDETQISEEEYKKHLTIESI